MYIYIPGTCCANVESYCLACKRITEPTMEAYLSLTEAPAVDALLLPLVRGIEHDVSVEPVVVPHLFATVKKQKIKHQNCVTNRRKKVTVERT